MTAEELKIMRDMDVKDVDKDSLVDLKNVKVNTNQPLEKRMESFLEQIKNPYCFKVNGVVVKVGFNPTGKSFEEQFESMLLGFS